MGLITSVRVDEIALTLTIERKKNYFKFEFNVMDHKNEGWWENIGINDYNYTDSRGRRCCRPFVKARRTEISSSLLSSSSTLLHSLSTPFFLLQLNSSIFFPFSFPFSLLLMMCPWTTLRNKRIAVLPRTSHMAQNLATSCDSCRLLLLVIFHSINYK